jgi:hypothetical protein
VKLSVNEIMADSNNDNRNRSKIQKNDEVLIKLKVQHEDNILTAIIDTGSQLNVVSREIAEKCFPLPINLLKNTWMLDANGGEGYLSGLIENVPLTCGTALTYANIYVGENLPFQLLLG